MGIIDGYIARKYFVTFFFTAFLFTLIAMVIDVSQKVEKFIEQGVSLQEIVFDYYLNFIPWINGILWPLFALLSVIFFTSRLARNTEIVAILSSGVSFNRLLWPFLFSSSILALVYFFGNHFFIPIGNKTYTEFENTYIDPGNIRLQTDYIHIFLTPESKIYIRHYRASDTSMRDVFLERFEDNELRMLIKAERMDWAGPPSNWRLTDYEIRTFDGDNESLVSGNNVAFDTTLNLLPQDFVRYTNQREQMTTRELREFIAYEKSKGLGTAKKMITEIHRRTADPVTLVILTIIGVAVASRKVRGGMGLHLAIGILIGTLFIILSRFSITFANQLPFNPGMTVWIPNILFAFVAIYMVLKAQK